MQPSPPPHPPSSLTPQAPPPHTALQSSSTATKQQPHQPHQQPHHQRDVSHHLSTYSSSDTAPPTTNTTTTVRTPPLATPEFKCHHLDCLRTFARKTSLTNHLKAHNNHKSRSIYRTKRARARAAALHAAAQAQAAAGGVGGNGNGNLSASASASNSTSGSPMRPPLPRPQAVTRQVHQNSVLPASLSLPMGLPPRPPMAAAVTSSPHTLASPPGGGAYSSPVSASGSPAHPSSLPHHHHRSHQQPSPSSSLPEYALHNVHTSDVATTAYSDQPVVASRSTNVLFPHPLVLPEENNPWILPFPSPTAAAADLALNFPSPRTFAAEFANPSLDILFGSDATALNASAVAASGSGGAANYGLSPSTSGAAFSPWASSALPTVHSTLDPNAQQHAFQPSSHLPPASSQAIAHPDMLLLMNQSTATRDASPNLRLDAHAADGAVSSAGASTAGTPLTPTQPSASVAPAKGESTHAPNRRHEKPAGAEPTNRENHLSSQRHSLKDALDDNTRKPASFGVVGSHDGNNFSEGDLITGFNMVADIDFD